MSHAEQDQLRSYLAAQSAKLSAAAIRDRVQEAADEFLAAVRGVAEATARKAPAEGEWSVAEVMDHVILTLEEVTAIMRTLAGGSRPARAMTIAAQPVRAAGLPFAELLDRLRLRQAAVSEFLDAERDEPHTDLRVSDNDFGEINWKGYALILRLHYKDHAQQVTKTVAAV